MINMENLKLEIEHKLLDWKKKKISPLEIQSFAEKKYENLSSIFTDSDKNSSVEFEIISQLEILNHQLIIDEDIPLILDFLKNENWDNWREYWDQIDYEKRKELLQGDSFYSV